jgi:hypothetical protein
MTFPLETLPSEDPIGGVVYLRIVLSPEEASRIHGISVSGKRLSRKSDNVVVFRFAFHIAVQQPFKPLWSRLLLYELEPSRASFALCSQHTTWKWPWYGIHFWCYTKFMSSHWCYITRRGRQSSLLWKDLAKRKPYLYFKLLYSITLCFILY